jgi:hypothetical protein
MQGSMQVRLDRICLSIERDDSLLPRLNPFLHPQVEVSEDINLR